MKFLFVSYVKTNEFFNEPEAWLKRINLYTGVLDKLAVNHTVISIEQIAYEGEVLKNGVQYYFKKFPDREKLLPVKLHACIKKTNPDVVVIHGIHFSLQAIQLRMVLNNRTKIIMQHHAEKPFTGIKKCVQRLADRYVDAYFFASKNMGMDWVKRGNLASPQKIHEVMEVSSIFAPVSRACAQSKTGITGQQLVYLWVGRLNANKDPLNVVRAFLRFAAQQTTAKLYMIYQNEDLLNDIKPLLAEHPYGKNIVLVGQIPHHELLYWYNSVDFIISGSHYESGGTAVCEAISCGCIPILTAIDAFKMVTDNGRCGILYETGNEDALVSALNVKPAHITEMRKRLLAYYDATLSFKAIAGRFSSVAASLFI